MRKFIRSYRRGQYGKMDKPKTEIVAGRNPVLELLRSPREVECVYIQSGLEKGPVGRILALARERGIPVKDVAPEKLQSLSGIASHQGVAAQPAAADYATMEDIYRRAGEAPLFVVLADGVEDPHNLGAIIRTAEAAGAHGLIIPKRHSAGLTPAVCSSDLPKPPPGPRPICRWCGCPTSAL